MMRDGVMRLSPMKRSLFLFFIMAAPLFAQQPPEIRFQSVRDFLKLPPDLHLGEAAGVAVNSKGHIFVFTRGNTAGPAYGASAARLLQFTPYGEFLRGWATISTPGPSPTPSRSIGKTTFGPPTKARTWSSRSTLKASSSA